MNELQSNAKQETSNKHAFFGNKKRKTQTCNGNTKLQPRCTKNNKQHHQQKNNKQQTPNTQQTPKQQQTKQNTTHKNKQATTDKHEQRTTTTHNNHTNQLTSNNTQLQHQQQLETKARTTFTNDNQ